MAATCPRCSAENHWPNCSNCGGTHFQYGPLSDGSEGYVCTSCNVGQSHARCSCGTLIPAKSFMPGWKRNLYESATGGKQGCLVAVAVVGGHLGGVVSRLIS